jgi:integrase
MANFKTGSGSHGGLKVRNLIERWLTAEEERGLLSASPEWLQEIIVFAANTGLRQSEILNLQWCNVDLFRRTITLLEQKDGGRDTLPVNAKTLDVLKARVKVRSLKTDWGRKPDELVAGGGI